MSKANGHYQDFPAPDPQPSLPLPEMPEAKPHRADRTSSEIVEIDSLTLPDGRILDLVPTPSPDQLAFLVWKDGEFTIEAQVSCEDRIYVPPTLPKKLAGALRLPSGLGPHLSPRDLIAKIEGHAQVFFGLPEDYGFLISAVALNTFFFDVLPSAVYLSICGPPGSRKTTLLRFLHCVTRRALHAGELSRASLYKLVDLVSPTLLLDEIDFGSDKANRELMRILRNGSRPGADIYVNGNRYCIYGPKVFCGRSSPQDAALASRTIKIAVPPSDDNLPRLDLDAERMIAADVQPLLERFRLEHYRDVHAAELAAASSFTPRMREIAQALAAPFLGDPELTERLLYCLKVQDEASRIDRSGEPEWVVAAALLLVSHEPGHRIYIGNLGLEVRRILLEIGETYVLSDKAVGWIARESLGVSTKRVGLGYYLQLTESVKRQIHKLARGMGLNKADILDSHAVDAGFCGPPCSLCTEFGLDKLPDGTKLKYVDLPRPTRRREPIFGPEKEIT